MIINKILIKMQLLLLCSIIIVFPITVVFAGSTTGGESNSGYTSGWKYMFNGASGNGYGLRMSLYNYDGSNLTYYSSVDFCTGGGCFDGLTANTFSAMSGRIAYEYGKTTLATSLTSKTISVNPKRFNCYDSGTNCSYSNYVHNDILNFYGLSSNSNYNTVKTNINNTFGTSITNLSNVYITIEPTVFFYECENYAVDSEGNGFYYDEVGNHTTCRISKYFYGTAYEFLKSGMYDDYSGMGNVLGKDVANAIKASSASANDDNCFVGTSNCSSSLISLVSDSDSDKSSPLNGINNKKGYGINVIWLGNYVSECSITTTDNWNYNLNITGNTNGITYGISNVAGTINNQTSYKALLTDTNIYGTIKDSSGNVVATCEATRTVPTCSETCSGSNDLLECAENYCSQMSSDTSSKRNCISSCGYAAPSFSVCNTNEYTNGKDTTCNESTSSAKESCTEATLSTYYMTECSEVSKITFGDSLPTTLLPGMSFKYNATLSGNKTCKVTFELDKWLYDYASSYTEEERQNLVKILENYEKLSNKTNISGNEEYTYNSDDAEIVIKITNKKDSKDTVSKKLVVEKTTNLLSDEYQIEIGKEKNASLYANGTKTTKKVLSNIEIKSSNETKYKLPSICINSETYEEYEPTNGKCDSNDDGPYDKIFTKKDNEDIEYITVVNVKKDSSNLDVDNNCYYDVEKQEPSKEEPKEENPKTADNKIIIIVVGTITALGLGFVSYKKIYQK